MGTWSGSCDIVDPWMGSPDILELAFTVVDDDTRDGDATVWSISEATARYTDTAEGSGHYSRKGGSVEIYLAMSALDYCPKDTPECSERFSIYVDGVRDRGDLEGTCEVSIGGSYGYAPAPGGAAPIALIWAR